ncbi:hypothetical protein G6F56_009061 [Rhizopus delemar]|nr:hypothetical protein G6F56_009061 [Rhizopus delemar]
MIVKPSMSMYDLDKDNEFLRQFGKGCEILYGKSAITPNMHFSTHMKEVLRDFGTVYSIWLYSFERYNKLIKNLDTNNKGHFELTFMKSFLKIKKSPKFIDSFSSDQLQPKHKKFLQTSAGFNSDTRKKSIGYSATAGSMQDFYHLSSIDAALTEVTGCEPLPWV